MQPRASADPETFLPLLSRYIQSNPTQ
jgi:hypothetical protein